MVNIMENPKISKFMEKPIPSFIVIVILSFIVCNIVGGIFSPFFRFMGPVNGTIPGLIIGGFITALLYVYVVKIKGFFSFSNFVFAFILACPLILYIVASLFDTNLMMPTVDVFLVGILLGLGPGVSEEILFRGVMISYLMKFFRNSKGIYSVLIFSAALFGLIHISNYFMGAPLDISIFQAFYSFAMGILMGALYLRTGNIWVPIIFHSIIDIIGLSFFSDQSVVIHTGFVLNTMVILTIIVSLICIVLGFYYVRSSKHDEVIAIWDEKWS